MSLMHKKLKYSDWSVKRKISKYQIECKKQDRVQYFDLIIFNTRTDMNMAKASHADVLQMSDIKPL